MPSVLAELLHFLGEVEVVFGLWAVVLMAGPAIHWAFSVLMFRLGIKPRPA